MPRPRSFARAIMLIAFASPLSSSATLPSECAEQLSAPYTAKLVKTRDDGSRIFELKTAAGEIRFFKENFTHPASERAVFDDLSMTVLAASFAKKLGLEKNIPDAQWRNSLTFVQNGETLTTKSGVLQEGVSDLVTPIDDFRARFAGQSLNAENIRAVLNSDEWPRLYADWKIFWSIFLQVDLNIANLARQGNRLALFDLGDLLNLPAVRAQMGVRNPLEQIHYNMPNHPHDRVEHRADFRLADPEFKKLAHTIADGSDEFIANLLGKSLSDHFPAPRGSVREHVQAMRQEAKRIIGLLNRGPFDY